MRAMKRLSALCLSLCFFSACKIVGNVDIVPVRGFEGYNIPDYFKGQIVDKENKINALFDVDKSISGFIFFTDAHWEINSKHSPGIIKHIQRNTGINLVFFGGDAFNGSHDKEVALSAASNFSDAFSSFDSFYPVIGNHDSNLITDNLNNPVLWLTDIEVFNFLHGRLPSDPKVHYGDYWYYYVDNPAFSTRYLCLDSGKWSLPINEREFVAEALATIPSGWHVIIITHIIYNAADLYNPKTVYIPPMMNALIEMAEAYNDRRVYREENQKVYDFTNSTGRIDCMIGGHIHRDYVGYSKGGIPLITLDCDCRFSYSEVGYREGTINEQCVTTVVLDYNNDMIHFVRIGRGNDMDVAMRK